MSYRVKEIYFTLQGEGAHAGRPAVFCRFAGCNLWTGREADRAAAVCSFCDTDFVGTDGPGGGAFPQPQALADAIASRWPDSDAPADRAARYVVCTGGEPLLQLDAPLIDALHHQGFSVAVETNGTRHPPTPGNPAPGSKEKTSGASGDECDTSGGTSGGIDWITVSPKAGAPLVLTAGDELKLVFPQPDLMPDRVADLDFTHFFLQPMDGPNTAANTAAAIDYCRQHPQWRLSIQTHKLLNLP